MRWSYKTVHYDYKKEGLLGGAFLDEAEIEESMNEFGRAGWELVSFIEVQEGLIATFKQPIDSPADYDRRPAKKDVSAETGEANPPSFFRPEKKTEEGSRSYEADQPEDEGQEGTMEQDREGQAARPQAVKKRSSGNEDESGGVGSIRIE